MCTILVSDRSSLERSLPDDDFPLSDEDSPVHRTETSLMDVMVKHAKSESFFDPKGQKMMVSISKLYRTINNKQALIYNEFQLTCWHQKLSGKLNILGYRKWVFKFT